MSMCVKKRINYAKKLWCKKPIDFLEPAEFFVGLWECWRHPSGRWARAGYIVNKSICCGATQQGQFRITN